ncbi:hypothetical protein CGMCC3_g1676 [Colletotrichum fructicola]|uniref:Heterokaryon incompatibility protein 6, OR allele n=1 Tax=Colletotrichum fructicola (strain Nara gc5) TaxID=1213859 RepID=A0A7J6J734_COLFN|nr:uncharacterized protein CGMCC3_g1676 [Colletotrichum fructicola]KAE9582350.1 hypothetical protein CGMCC3_g1676 [Colletotrichum fructicola]KAF4485057.1 Heterokaryon incompatibility protein 6, OR allele [Colletotrichum fructicola Nara gc5]
MLSSIFLASAFAASGAFAAISQGSWAVRADFSRCNSSTPLEPVLDGAKSTYSTTDKIVDFNIDSPFQGNLVIKVAGAAGYGSPYPPQQVAVEVFAEATGGDPGVWANATVIPGMGQPALISGIYWNTRSDITLTPASNETVSVETIFDGGSLVVFYCGLPDGPTPLSKRKHFSPDIDGLLAAQAAKSSSIPFLPPDEPPGQMRLWWPPCVPYVTTGTDGHRVPVQPPQGGKSISSSDEGKSPGEPHRFSIYPQRLRKDEFRVMCLNPVEDVNHPIHVSLEVYDDLRYHEYETVSYTWGGENGDSRLNQPIYIGPYWDILLQTRNCWEMLRHMRPWKGVRTIWVDAICINQTDMQERQEQVAKMGRIYEKASRVVIYLGPDLVPPTSTSSLYPRRHNLREFDTLPERPQLPSDYLIPSKQWKLSDVFSREYFRRLWIIQELIMSSNITVRIGDTEFIVDHTVSSYAAHACHIPWFAFITRKSIGDQSGNNLRAAVEFVDASRASDPRDKIFGILGLIDSEEHQIAANYSISFRHLAIGYYAYCMLTKRDIRVLLHASGRRAPEGIPSWVPPAQYDVSRSRRLIPSTSNLQLDWLCKCKDFIEAYSGHHECYLPEEGGFKMIAKSACLTRHTCYKVACEWISYTFDPVWYETCWHSQAAIESSTGAFNLTAKHIMSFGNIDFSKAEIEKVGEVHVHALKAGTSTLYIYANECIIGPEDEPDKTHLFVLCDNDDEVCNANLPYPMEKYTGMPTKSRLCVLQQTNDEAKFRILSASVIACFHVLPKLEDLFISSASISMCHYGSTSFEYYRLSWNIFSASDDKEALPLPLLRADCRAGTHCHGQLLRVPESSDTEHLMIYTSHPIHNARRTWAALDGDPKEYNEFFDPWRSYSRYPSPRLAFPAINNGVVFLQVFQSILDAEKSGSSVDFFNVYFQAVREYHPQLIQWKSRRRDSDDDEDKIIDLVQLRFEPNQYDILEGILDMIQEDVKKSKEWSAQWPPPPPIHGGKDFNPPFLRIGWRDLALSQTNEASENPSANDEDVYGFYALDAINKAVDKERLLYDRAETEALSGHALDWSDEAVDEDPVDGGSHCQNSNGWLYDDSVVREHKGQDLWVAFDILSLTLWAQIHPNMAELRGLSRFCKDGENEMTRLLRPQTEEEHRLTCLNWPVGIMEDFKIDGELRHITII